MNVLFIINYNMEDLIGDNQKYKMYLKRNKTEKFWSIPRKGTKYLAVAKHNHAESIPLVVALRDVLKIVKNKKELKSALNEKQIKINSKEIRETNYPISLFDVLTLVNAKKSYRAVLSKNRKMVFEEVAEKDSKTKIFKLLNKKMLPGKTVQFNLNHGKNIISKEKVNIGDSILLNIEDNKILKIIPMEKGKHAYVIKGKHIGQEGKIEDIVERGGKQIAKITVNDERINVWLKNLIVMEK